MQLDPRQVTRAAKQLERALRYVDGVRAEAIPRLGMARRTGGDAARSLLGDAADWATSASRALDDAPTGPLTQARDGIEALAGYADHARDLPTGALRRQLRGRPGVAIQQARDAQQLLREVESGWRAHEAGQLVTWTKAALGDCSARFTKQRAAQVLAHALPHELDGLAPFVDSLSESTVRRVVAARISHYSGDLRPLWDALVDSAAMEPLEPRILRRAFDVTAARVPGDARPVRPAWLDELAPDRPVRLDALQAADLQLAVRATSREDVVDHVLEQLSHPWGTLNKLHVYAAAAAEQAPEHLRVELSTAAGTGSVDAILATSHRIDPTEYEWIVDAWTRLATSTPERAARQVERLLARDASPEQVRRLARIAEAHPELLVGEAAAAQPWIDELFSSGRTAQLDLQHARRLRVAWELVRDVGGDRSRLLERLDELLAIPIDARTHGQMEPLTALAALPDALLPDALRPLRVQLREYLHPNMALAAWTSPTSGAARAVDVVAAAVDAERTASTGAVSAREAMRELHELLDEALDGAWTEESHRRLLALDALPDEVWPPTTTNGTRQFLADAITTGAPTAPSHQQVDMARLLRDAADIAADPASTAATVRAELASILARPDEVLTVADARRIVTLMHVPGSASPYAGNVPKLPSGSPSLLASLQLWQDDIVDESLLALSSYVRNDLRDLRIATEAAELVADPTTTAATVRDEVIAITALDERSWTADALHRLVVLDALPPHLRVGQPVPAHHHLARYDPLTRMDHPKLANELRLLRHAALAAREVADGSVTREALQDEFILLLTRTDDLLDEAQVDRLARIASMPASVRPALGLDDESRVATIHDLQQFHLGTGPHRATLNQLRKAALADVRLTPEQIVHHARTAEGVVDIDRIPAILHDHLVALRRDELARIGLDDVDLLASALGPSRGSGDRTLVQDATRRALRIARCMERTDPVEARLVDELVHWLDRNARRADRTLHDGYSTHPDYAEHGRAVAIADLLRQLRDTGRSAPARPTPHGDGILAATDSLAW